MYDNNLYFKYKSSEDIYMSRDKELIFLDGSTLHISRLISVPLLRFRAFFSGSHVVRSHWRIFLTSYGFSVYSTLILSTLDSCIITQSSVPPFGGMFSQCSELVASTSHPKLHHSEAILSTASKRLSLSHNCSHLLNGNHLSKSIQAPGTPLFQTSIIVLPGLV